MTTFCYCTYFDHRYIARGLAMVRSLRRYVRNAEVFVLCLDEAAAEILTELNEPGVRPIRLADFEASDEALLRAKADGRSLIEYYFTCTPSLIDYVMRQNPGVEVTTYLDGDLAFFSDPQPIYEAMVDSSTLIIPHRYPPGLRTREKYGLYNVGWVSFRQDVHGRACLLWWRNKTLEWCRDHVDEANERFADQRYLDKFPSLFPETHVLQHKGANVAPWNLAGHKLTREHNGVIVDGTDPLIFFHFHGVKPFSESLYFTSLAAYGVSPQNVLRESIYVPYLRELREIGRQLMPFLSEVPRPLRELDGNTRPIGQFNLKKRIKLFRSFLRGDYVRLPPT